MIGFSFGVWLCILFWHGLACRKTLLKFAEKNVLVKGTWWEIEVILLAIHTAFFTWSITTYCWTQL